MDINKELSKIDNGAMFFCGLDSDMPLISLGAGGDVPFSAAWDKNGYRAYRMDQDDDYQPIKRETFIRLVKIKEPLI